MSEEGRKPVRYKALELSITGLDDEEAQAELEKKKKVVKRSQQQGLEISRVQL